MHRLRHRIARAAAVLFLCALLLPWLAHRAHSHADHVAARPSALCVVADHVHVASAPPVAAFRPVLQRLVVAASGHAAPALLGRPAETGRAPPPARLVRVA